MRNVPTLAPPFPDLIQHQFDLEPTTASDEDLAEAIHLVANFMAPLRLKLDILRAEFTHRQHERSRAA